MDSIKIISKEIYEVVLANELFEAHRKVSGLLHFYLFFAKLLHLYFRL